MMAGQPRTRRSLWIPWILVGVFVLVVAVNAVMIWVAFATWPGLLTENAYERGLSYNQALGEAKAQEALGWQVETMVEARAGGHAGIEVVVHDRYGSALWDAVVAAKLMRPTHAGHDVAVALVPRGDGSYAGEVALPLPGSWDVHVEVEHGSHVHRQSERVLIDP